MTVVTTGDAGLAPEMKVYYDRRLLTRALPVLLHSKFAQKRGIPKRGGKTIEFRKFSTLGVATTPLTEGVPPAGKTLEVTNITATVSQFGDFVAFSDLVATTTIDPLLEETTDLLAEEAAETIEELVRNQMILGTNAIYSDAGAVGTNDEDSDLASGDELSVALVRAAVLNLQIGRAKPINGAFQAIIHPRAAFDLQSDDEWKEAQIAGERTGRIEDGSIGMLYGVKFWVSDKAYSDPNGGAGSIPVYYSLFMGANAYGIVDLAGHNLQTVFKPLGSAGSADPLNQSGSMGWKISFTTRILDDANIVRVVHTVSTDDV